MSAHERRSAFNHELKLARAFKHLMVLDAEVKTWVGGDHHSIRYEYDRNAKWDGPVPPRNSDPTTGTYYLAGSVLIPNQGPETAPDGVEFGQGCMTALVTAEQPPNDTLGVLIGDVLHNLRSALDNFAYALAAAYTKPMTREIVHSSEFPIFGDKDRSGNTGRGAHRFHELLPNRAPTRRSGLTKISGWHPDAQTEVERLQPYHRKNAFREDPLWLLHELDRIDKHRLLHTTVAGFLGTIWDINNFRNVRCIGPGLIQSFSGTIETDTPISRIYGVRPLVLNADVHMEIRPALDVVLSPQNPTGGGAPLVSLLTKIYIHVTEVVVPTLVPYL